VLLIHLLVLPLASHELLIFSLLFLKLFVFHRKLILRDRWLYRFHASVFIVSRVLFVDFLVGFHPSAFVDLALRQKQEFLLSQALGMVIEYFAGYMQFLRLQFRVQPPLNANCDSIELHNHGQPTFP
jgi:hypothetical protein